MNVNCTQSPLFHQLVSDMNLPLLDGFPDLSVDLEWTKGLFVVGGLGALNTGPDAANLMGMRRASKVVTRRLGLQQWLRQTPVYTNPFHVFDDDDDTDSESSVE